MGEFVPYEFNVLKIRISSHNFKFFLFNETILRILLFGLEERVQLNKVYFIKSYI